MRDRLRAGAAAVRTTRARRGFRVTRPRDDVDAVPLGGRRGSTRVRAECNARRVRVAAVGSLVIRSDAIFHREIRWRDAIFRVRVRSLRSPRRQNLARVPVFSPHARAMPRGAKDSPDKGGEDEFFAAESTRASEEVERVTSGIELEREASKTFGSDTAILPRLLDASGVLQDAASAIIDDTFNACFAFSDNPAWNWNFYLFPLWCVGVVLRYLVLFPIRLAWIVTCTLLFIGVFTLIHNVTRGKLRANLERDLVHLYAACFVISWTGVIKYHGPKPTQRSGHVYVANHTSIIDYIMLCQVRPNPTGNQILPTTDSLALTQLCNHSPSRNHLRSNL